MNRLTRILPITAGLLCGALVVGCTSDLTGPGTPSLVQTSTSNTGTLTECSPQPSSSAKAFIGPDGGSIRVGNHTLVVPARALKTSTWITMQTRTETINRVSFGPEGLSFNRNYLPHLIMSYNNCSVPPGATQRIAYVNESLAVLETPPSYSDPLTQTVDGRIAHFSDYVILSTYAVVY